MIAAFSVIFKICLQEIGKEKDFEDNEHDKKLDQDDQPNLFAPPWHRSETLGIKTINPPEYLHG